MSNFSRNTASCRYHHDALDRLIDSTFPNSDNLQRFYCKTRLATEIQGPVRYSLFQHDDHLLAQQQQRDGITAATLVATDQQRSVRNVLDATEANPISYTAYGHRPRDNGLLSLLGFNGERPDPLTGHYHLGNGYRQFNPVLMRFNSPDNWSPFGKGGLNAYAYCVGDPVNRSDPTGHFAPVQAFQKAVLLAVGVIAAGSTVGSFIVEDEILEGVLIGVSVVSTMVLSAGAKHLYSQDPPSTRPVTGQNSGARRPERLVQRPRPETLSQGGTRWRDRGTSPQSGMELQDLPPDYDSALHMESPSRRPSYSEPPPAYSELSLEPGGVPTQSPSSTTPLPIGSLLNRAQPHSINMNIRNA